MTKCRKILLLLPVVLMVLVVALVFGPSFWPSGEPSYGGLTLSEWLEVHSGISSSSKTSAQAEDAIRHIGTEAVPYFIKWIQSEPSEWATRLEKTRNIVKVFTFPDSRRMIQLRERPSYAVEGFKILGPQAKAAIPALTNFLNGSGPNTRSAMFALAYIGKDSLPSLMPCLTNQPARIRLYAVESMPLLGTNARPAVPTLLKALNDPDTRVRMRVTNTLRQIAPEALNRATQK
jgi:HEAT repeat protein